MTRRATAVVFALSITACGEGATWSAPEPALVDAGRRDAGTSHLPDAGRAERDAGVVDPPLDAGTVDAEWEWMSPLPQGNGLWSVSLATPTDGWAVGGLGTTIRYDSGVWKPTPS